MKIDGNCLCGAATFKAESESQVFGICHCTDCQKISGAPYRATVRVLPDSFELRGPMTEYVKIGSSGSKRRSGFCSKCGASIYSCPDEPSPAVYLVRLGIINQKQELKPGGQIWTRSSLPWIHSLADVPANPMQPGLSA